MNNTQFTEFDNVKIHGDLVVHGTTVTINTEEIIEYKHTCKTDTQLLELLFQKIKTLELELSNTKTQLDNVTFKLNEFLNTIKEISIV